MEKPWVKHYDPGALESIEYPDMTLYEIMNRTAEHFPEAVALAFEGTHISYASLKEKVNSLSEILKEDGVKKGDTLTICLPNIPNAPIFLYAANKIGAIVNMVHPKTPLEELLFYLEHTKSKHIVLLNAFFSSYHALLSGDIVENIYLCEIGDFLSPSKKLGFYISKGRKIAPIPSHTLIKSWKEISIRMKNVVISSYERRILPHDAAVYFHSGGTTGTPKTVVLSSYNINALAAQGPQIVNIPDPYKTQKAPDVKMLTILPLFHGFSLAMGLHTMVYSAMTVVLVPAFSPEALAKSMLTEKVDFIVAVPTLYEGILKSKRLEKADLSFLRCCFCGGDSLSSDLKGRFEHFLHQRGAGISLREGFGLTETVTVCAVNPEKECKSDSIGLPLADILMKIVEPNTKNELPIGEHGEICVTGPTVMLGYLNDPEGTDETIKVHEDGRRWVHTGDFGYRDEEGYFYFLQRLKRIIKVSGIPVFPSQIEGVIASVEGVNLACAIAKPHPYRIHVVKALVTVDEKLTPLEKDMVIKKIQAVCEEKLFPHARPVEIECRADFPLTMMGKVDYRLLEKEEKER